MIHYGELQMTAASGLAIQPRRRMIASLSMTASSKLHPSVAGMELDLRQEDIAAAAKLLLLCGKTDEELAGLIRASKLANLMKGKSDRECADYVRDRALAELKDLQERAKMNPAG